MTLCSNRKKRAAHGSRTYLKATAGLRLVLTKPKRRYRSWLYSMFVPTMLTFLANATEKGLVDPQQLSVILSSSSLLSTTLRDCMLTAFPRAHLWDICGATGLGAVTLIDHSPTSVIGSVGLPSLAQVVKLRDDGNEVPQGAVGGLHTAGPTLMTEYYKQPDAIAAAFRGAFMSVGDLARQDGNGYFFLVDRKLDMIISSGENVYPTERPRGGSERRYGAVIGVQEAGAARRS